MDSTRTHPDSTRTRLDSTRTHLLDLPDEILLHIMDGRKRMCGGFFINWMDEETLKNFRLTCKKLSDIGTDRMSTAHIRGPFVDEEVQENSRISGLAKFLSKRRSVYTLIIIGLNDDEIMEMSRDELLGSGSVNHITYIWMRECRVSNDTTIRSLAKACPHVSDFEYSYMRLSSAAKLAVTTSWSGVEAESLGP